MDSNHADVVAALRRVGASVVDLSRVGHGCFDLLVGYRGRNFCLEIKANDTAARRENWTPEQQALFLLWRGNYDVVTSPEQAILIITDGR